MSAWCIVYIMKRTQLYLDDDVWETLRIRSRQSGASVSELVRQAVRDKYVSGTENRAQAMQSLVGIWKGRTDLGDTQTYVRKLRKGVRLKRRAR